MNSDRMTLTADTPNAISKTTGNEMSASCLATAYIVPHKMKALMIVPSMGIDYYRDCCWEGFLAECPTWMQAAVAAVSKGGCFEPDGRGGGIRTHGLFVPNENYF